MCEVADFSGFKRPKQLYAYFVLDPAIKESDKFKGTKFSMPKRGSRIARKVLFTFALAGMHKVSNIALTVLRDNKPFVLWTAKEHEIAYRSNLTLVA